MVLRGELIGINTAIIGPNGGNVGIGFAIPSNMVKNLVSQILEYGEVRRGVLGVSGYSVNGEIAKAMELEASQGGFVERVTEGSAAEDAGIEAGDVITQVNGKHVKSFGEIKGKIGSIGAGKSVNLTVVKGNGKTKEYSVTLKKAESANIEPASIHNMLEGAKLSNHTKALGIVVDSIEPDSPAEVIGLQKGDIVAGVNKMRTRNIAELRNYLSEVKGISLLKIIRGNTVLYIRIR